jgi:hypothetical protein
MAENTATETVEANWDALESDPAFGTGETKAVIEPKTEDIINKDVAETPEQVADKAAEAEKTAANALVLEAANKAVEADKTKIDSPAADELSLDEDKDALIVYPENSFKSIAQKLGSDIKEDTADAFKEVYITKAEAAKQAATTKESLFAALDPKTAAALEMIELGVPQHLIGEPTKEIDGYLKLDDAELLRAELATNPKWTEEMINQEIEDQIENGKIKHSVDKIRAELEVQKEAITSETTNIIQKYTEQKQKAAENQKALERTETINELGKIQEIAGVKIPQKIKEQLIAKYSNGEYDKELSSPMSKAEYIVKKELEERAVKHLLNKVSEQFKQESTNEKLNIPVSKTTGGGAKSITNNEAGIWDALDNSPFGK